MVEVMQTNCLNSIAFKHFIILHLLQLATPLTFGVDQESYL